MKTFSELIEEIDNSKKDQWEFEDIANYYHTANRELYIGGIDENVGDSIEAYIRLWNKQDEEDNIPIEERKPIKLYIDSPGGDLCATLTMIDAISLSKTPVYTINVGTAYSGGFFTFIAGHKRYAYPSASFMFHEGSVGNVGDAGKFRNFSEFYVRQLDSLKDIVLKYTKIDEELYDSKRKDDWWMTSKDAIELGIADEIVKELI